MIYTLTLNPSLDYIVNINNINIHSLNRSTDETIIAGGKGINVSIVLNNLGINNTALGYIAGFTGDEIKKQLELQGVNCDFIKLNDGLSRINIKLKDNGETEINASGPNISDEALEVLYNKIKNLNEDDYLILSGSIPKNLPNNIYNTIIEKISNENVKIIIDSTKDSLLNALKYRPFLIKPNHHELAEMFDVELNTHDDIIYYAKKLQKMGARNVLISMAKDGAIFINENSKVIRKEAPKGILKNSIGAGDSMVAGFVTGFIRTNNLDEAFKFSIATGSASAFSNALANEESVQSLLKQI